jgi:hypothetical protein
VATIGKLPGLDREERVGWDEIGRILSGKPRPEVGLFSPPAEDPPSWATVKLSGVRVERLRCFGDVYLGLLLWNRLGFAEFCREQMWSGREEIPWSIMAAVLVLVRFCAPSSELQIAASWYDKTALDDLLGVRSDKVMEDRLYRALDALLPHKDELCRHLQRRYGELFGCTFDFMFYDITSTYFEGRAKANPQAKRGYSRDGRPDCPQICIGLVTSREGLPLAFEIFDGNRVDVTTTREMVQIMEAKYGKANRVWVMDRGNVVEHLHPAHGSGRFLPHGEIRFGHAADFPSQAGSDPGSYPGLFPGAHDAANPSAVDEGIGTRHHPEKTPGGVT